MKIGLRILFGYFLIVGVAAWFVLNVFIEEVKPGVRATMEDTLIDTAQLLATLVSDDMRAGKLQQASFVSRMQYFAQRSIDVKVLGVHKQSMDYRVYITDSKGLVVFDSENKAVGQDYSKWNDVYLTLHGRYGARSTRSNPDDEASSVMHVAAPIKDGDKIIGVLTVAKPLSTIAPFIERSQKKILRRGAWLLLISLAIGLGFSWWLNRSLRQLQDYAASVESGEKVVLPPMGNNEFAALGRALEAMRIKLEGKQYVERLMHTLAHELKSPIAAIQGSAELLTEDMPAADRQRFLNNIIEQNQRQKQLIDKLLALIKLENQQVLASVQTVDVPALLAQVAADFHTRSQQKQVQIECHSQPVNVQGDGLLLRQAIGNLLDNALDFTPPGSQITLSANAEGKQLAIRVTDQGVGIPAYASERIFERFYSLARPDADKSTGLGLPFAREVALLHGGKLGVSNHTAGGACACLQLPL